MPYVAVVCLLFLIQAPGLGAKLKMASIGAATLACALVPFMVLMFSSSGTPLFPVLGAGVHESAYQAALRRRSFA